MPYRRLSYRYTGGVSEISSASYANFWRSGGQTRFAHPHWQPPTDLYETPTTIIVKAEIAGMAEEDFEISLYKNALVIEGVRSWGISSAN